MTHGCEKSDSAIGAGKPTNKVEQSAAEPVEPRAEAEGNAGQQSTCRAQDRESVSQALERIRQAARQRKKEKFTALFHHLTIDLLEDAFDELKEDAAAGVDGQHLHIQPEGRSDGLGDGVRDVMKFKIKEHACTGRADFLHDVRPGGGEQFAADLECTDRRGDFIGELQGLFCCGHVQCRNDGILHANDLTANVYR